ncbi:TylF/MycF/NovP-related O-methyltransferase [Pelagibius sp. Alg239-R121]|uniref:TylF/MycF/NovP-related O-methyltransferase n=1 Tax=Pelagibius sp. Alg239-R121 TaxID=2993448 RepID=UPI0024A66182|nr:TylF/MycF/NovP-related O-methyltransferase [Pelagibius sp. Alg239-R121]
MTDQTYEDRVGGNVRTDYDARDSAHWEKLESLITGAGLSIRDVLKSYPAFIQRRDLPRMLGHYELFKLIADMPGSVAELGVFRGAGLFTWANLLETFCPGDRTRKAFGFDHFEGYAAYQERDGDAQPWVERVLGTMVSDGELAHGLVDLHNQDNLLPGVERCRIIDGEISKTVPRFASENLGTRLSLLYFDIGLYEPTIAGLKHLYPLVIPGGVVAFNGFGMPPWQGEAEAIEEYFSDKGGVPKMKKFPFSTVPYAYFIKDEAR